MFRPTSFEHDKSRGRSSFLIDLQFFKERNWSSISLLVIVRKPGSPTFQHPFKSKFSMFRILSLEKTNWKSSDLIFIALVILSFFKFFKTGNCRNTSLLKSKQFFKAKHRSSEHFKIA